MRTEKREAKLPLKPYNNKKEEEVRSEVSIKPFNSKKEARETK